MGQLLDFKILKLGSYELLMESVLSLILTWVICLIALKLIKRAIYGITKIDIAKKYSVYTLVRYVAFVFLCFVSLQILGFNLSVLLAGSAALLVGLGLGIQHLFSDYISGIIILLDSTVKVGDVIETNGLVCKVEKISLRTTTVLTRDDKYIILPNTDLTRNQLINWTHNTVKARFEVNVGIEYGTDVEKVINILKSSAEGIKEISVQPSSFVRLNNFGESSMLFTIYFWTEDVFRVENIKSNLRILISKRLEENNVKIPLPQRVIHAKF